MPSTKPNILLLFTDQHRADAMGWMGHPDVKTPHLDRLASQSVRFTRAHCQDAVCMPSRTSMMCGLYPRTLGCLSNGDRSETMRQAVPLAKVLRDAGYFTAAYGKRHLPAEPYRCDDGWCDLAAHEEKESPGHSYLSSLSERDHQTFARDWAAEWGPDPAPLAARPTALPEDQTMEAFTARKTIDLIHRMADDDQPFFCWASFYRPHQPYTPLPRYRERFDASRWGKGRLAGDGISLPPAFREPRSHVPPSLLGHFGENETWVIERAREDEQLFRDYIACYYACLEEIDDHIGRILAELDATGQAENTIVVYTSDHGEFVGAHALAEKAATSHNVYLDTLQVPMMMRDPRTDAAPRMCKDLVELVDLYPTLLELADVKTSALSPPLEGQSLAKVIRGEAQVAREFSVSENWVQSTVVTDDYVLGVWRESRNGWPSHRPTQQDMMFDLRHDPHQTRNLIDDADYAQIVSQLREHLTAWEAAHPVCATVSQPA